MVVEREIQVMGPSGPLQLFVRWDRRTFKRSIVNQGTTDLTRYDRRFLNKFLKSYQRKNGIQW